MTDLFQLHSPEGPVEAVGCDTAVTVGVFDGVHRGHQALIQQLAATDGRLAPLIVTLTTHPSFALGRRPSEYWLDEPTEHRRLLFDAGAHYVAEMPFTPEVARLSACRLAELMLERLRMRVLLLGYDSRFGSKADDDFDRLPRLAGELGFRYGHGEPFLLDGQAVSSSRIRTSLLEGDVALTARLLGRPYSITGGIGHGRGVGHTLGFPTANISLSGTRKMLPREGVYAVRLTTPHSPRTSHVGMANLGAAPTFGVDKPLLEVHLIDFEGDLYGQTVEVHFLHRLRDIMRFDSPEALQQQLKSDLEHTRLWS